MVFLDGLSFRVYLIGRAVCQGVKTGESSITAPNPDGNKNIVEHITKHGGMKTPYTSVSENPNAIRHFRGDLFKTDSDEKKEKVLASRALQYAQRAKEALINWQFSLTQVKKKDRVSWCYEHIQKYFQRI